MCCVHAPTHASQIAIATPISSKFSAGRILALVLVLCLAAAAATSEVDEFAEAPVQFGQQVEVEQEEIDSPSPPIPVPEIPVAAKKAKPERGPPRSFILEYVGLVFMAVYAIAYFYGCRQNRQTAAKWVSLLAPTLKAQFELVGPARPQEEWLNESLLFQDSPSQFTSYCTGRRGCEGMLLELSLERRQDLFYYMGRGWLFPSSDMLQLTIVMSPDALEPIVCAVVPSKHHKTVRLATDDLKDHTGVVSLKSLPISLTVLAEGGEVANAVIQPQVAQLLATHSSFIELLHVTDMNANSVMGWKEIPKKVLRFHYKLPPFPISRHSSTEALSSVMELVDLSLAMIDNLSSLKLSSHVRSRAIERRKEMELAQLKKTKSMQQELAQRRKAERLAKEKEEYNTLTPEAQARRDAKEMKKKMSRMQKKSGKIKIMN